MIIMLEFGAEFRLNIFIYILVLPSLFDVNFGN